MDKKVNIERPAKVEHHHKGKTSEGRLDKEIILKELNIIGGQTIVDAGCGNGYMAKEFSILLNNNGKIYAMDADGDAIEILKKETGDSNIEAIEADISKTIPVGDGSADLIYLANVLHGFSEGQIESFQKEVKRVLKPKGRLAIVEIEKEGVPFGPPMNIRFSPDELREKITLAAKTPEVKVEQYYYMQIFENKN